MSPILSAYHGISRADPYIPTKFSLGGAGAFAADPDKAVDKISTATPIKHVLIIVGENRFEEVGEEIGILDGQGAELVEERLLGLQLPG